MVNPQTLLRDVFGFDAFRPGQEDVVEAVVEGHNVLAIMPTGGGKSLCFQIPALLREGVTLVVSPLIALMRDQVRGLQAAGVAAGALTSGHTQEETDSVFQALAAGQLKLLYLAPERLASTAMQAALKRYNIALIAVDEAHCVSQWGHDFRPDYLRIGELRRVLNVPVAAFTATADRDTQQEIIERLFAGSQPQVFLRGFDRPNIHLAFTAKDAPRRQILDFVAPRKGQSGIVYCGTRAKTQALSAALNEVGHRACYYHGGMEAEDRRIVEGRFANEDGLIVVATVAFGMGVDKPDIRWVAHADLPKSIESYYQEIGRAGRDGGPAETLTLYGPEDIRLRRAQIDEGLAPVERRAADHGRLNALLGLAEALICRRQTLLAYFGETTLPCGHCDLCDAPPDRFEATEAVRKALSAILRSDERFGGGHVIDILLGNKTDKICAHGHDSLSTFGVGKEFSKSQWQAIFRQMMGHDLIRPDSSRHGALRMTDAALPLLRGAASLTLRADTVKSAPPARRVKALVSEDDAPLLSALKAKRRALAEAANVPAYIIFNDKTLIEMAETRPASLDDMARISGIGTKKLDRFGQDFLQVIAGEAAHMHPLRRKLAGRQNGAVFDRLLAVQTNLARGESRIEKPLSCSAGLLAKVAKLPGSNPEALKQLLGEKRYQRFGEAFLEVLLESP
ncbi:DNA helicase RecQ [Rhodobacterales bacterium FZCC0083]|nr:DNA helicase RecQ [Rhodobacterales bacterium FZCC0083]